MYPLRRIAKAAIEPDQFLVGAILAILLVCIPFARAGSPIGVCGVLEDFGGKAQILDSTRSVLLDTDVRAALPCGAWVSTEDGWARIVHRDGYRILVGSNSFVELLEHEENSDQLVLYRGQLRVEAGSGNSTGEVRVLSPHARLRIRSGQAIVIYSQSEQETQAIALKNTLVFENRFEPSGSVKLKSGEASSINFRAMRVTPSVPMAVSAIGLRQKLADLRLEEVQKREVIKSVRSRQSRQFASLVKPDLSAESTVGARAPAGMEFSSNNTKTAAARTEYRQHPPHADDTQAEERWTNRLMGGVKTKEANKILHPETAQMAAVSAHLKVEDVEKKSRKPAKSAQGSAEAEKERLLRELSQIKVE